MGSDDLFKKRRSKKVPRRKAGTRSVSPESYLIVTEGTKTEPIYFEELANTVKEGLGGTLDVQVEGKGRGTIALVHEAERIASEPGKDYQHIWVVFDKDDFGNFDEAISLAEADGYQVAWSNQSFEHWLYLYFDYCDSALSRNGWCNKLDAIFKSHGICAEGYKKTQEGLYSLVGEYGNLEFAIANARKEREAYRPVGRLSKPSTCDPCTTVDILVRELTDLLKD